VLASIMLCGSVVDSIESLLQSANPECMIAIHQQGSDLHRAWIETFGRIISPDSVSILAHSRLLPSPLQGCQNGAVASGCHGMNGKFAMTLLLIKICASDLARLPSAQNV